MTGGDSFLSRVSTSKFWIGAGELTELCCQREACRVVDNFLELKINHSFRTREFGDACRIPVNQGAPAELKSAAAVEIDKQQSSVWIHRQIAQRVEHAVAVVVGECEVLVVDYPDKTGIAALMRYVGSALGIIRRNEERVRARDLLLLCRR